MERRDGPGIADHDQYLSLHSSDIVVVGPHRGISEWSVRVEYQTSLPRILALCAGQGDPAAVARGQLRLAFCR
jgi:hypothetical protein